MQFETDGGAIGSTVISQISAGRKNRLWLEIDGAQESLAFSQEEPESLWCGRREGATIINRDPAFLSPEAARLATLPAGHPQGYADCFDGFVADVYDAIRGGEPADGLPVFADGLRAARITDAVLASACDGRWVDVPAPEPLAVTRMTAQAPLLEVRGIAKQYPGVRALDGVDFDVTAGRGALPARPQRRRQVHADQVRVRRRRPDGGRDPRRRRAAPGRRAVGVAGPRGRDDLPGARPGRGPDGGRERVPRPRAAPRRSAEPRADAQGDHRAARAARPRGHPAGRARAQPAAGRPAGRLDRPRALARRPAADHGRAVRDPRRTRRSRSCSASCGVSPPTAWE